MKFGPVDIERSEGALLAHTTMAGGKRYRKAHRLTREDIAALREAGIDEIVAAVLSPDDLDEDAAATRLAESMIFRGIEAKPAATGRANLHALEAGVFTVDASLVDAINAVDQAITVATRRPARGGREGPDGRDGEDHSLRGRRADREGALPRSRPGARYLQSARSAPCGPG